MTSSDSPRMMVVKKEDKEQKLKTLIEAALEAAAGTEVCLVVQTAASPVARALAAIAPALAATGTTFKVVIAKPETTTTTILPVGASAAYRVLSDARCHDAHELLVVGETAWIGDSMRRNPSATDSFELHAPRDRATAIMVQNSFERLWRISAPADIEKSPATAVALDLAGRLAALTADAGSTVTAATRH